MLYHGELRRHSAGESGCHRDSGLAVATSGVVAAVFGVGIEPVWQCLFLGVSVWKLQVWVKCLWQVWFGYSLWQCSDSEC